MSLVALGVGKVQTASGTTSSRQRQAERYSNGSIGMASLAVHEWRSQSIELPPIVRRRRACDPLQSRYRRDYPTKK